MKYPLLSILLLAGCCEKPDPVELNEWRNKAQTLEQRLAFVLDSAQKAHDAHIAEILSRPTIDNRINENFTVSPDADAAYRKFREQLLKRPERHMLGADTLH